jgi:hypothetical protein
MVFYLKLKAVVLRAPIREQGDPHFYVAVCSSERLRKWDGLRRYQGAPTPYADAAVPISR